MGFNSLLLIVIIWLLWSIHQDLTESNDRQRSIKTALSKLANRFEQILEQIPELKTIKASEHTTESKSQDLSE